MTAHPAAHRPAGDQRRLAERISIVARGDRRERDGADVVLHGEVQAVLVAHREVYRIGLVAGVPRSHGVDDELGLQAVSAGNLRTSHVASLEGCTLAQKLGAGCLQDRVVQARAAQKRRVGGVDHAVAVDRRNVAVLDNDLAADFVAVRERSLRGRLRVRNELGNRSRGLLLPSVGVVVLVLLLLFLLGSLILLGLVFLFFVFFVFLVRLFGIFPGLFLRFLRSLFLLLCGRILFRGLFRCLRRLLSGFRSRSGCRFFLVFVSGFRRLLRRGLRIVFRALSESLPVTALRGLLRGGFVSLFGNLFRFFRFALGSLRTDVLRGLLRIACRLRNRNHFLGEGVHHLGDRIDKFRLRLGLLQSLGFLFRRRRKEGLHHLVGFRSRRLCGSVLHIADGVPQIVRLDACAGSGAEAGNRLLALLGHVRLRLAGEPAASRGPEIGLRCGSAAGILCPDKPVAVVSLGDIHKDVGFLVLLRSFALRSSLLRHLGVGGRDRLVEPVGQALHLREKRSRIAKTALVPHQIKDILFHLEEAGNRKPGALAASEHPFQFLKRVVRNAEVLVGTAAPEIEEHGLHPGRNHLREIRQHARLVDVHVPHGGFRGIFRRIISEGRHGPGGRHARKTAAVIHGPGNRLSKSRRKGVRGKCFALSQAGSLLQLAADPLGFLGIVLPRNADRLRGAKVHGVHILGHRNARHGAPCAKVLADTHQRAAEKVPAFPLLRIVASRIIDIQTDSPYEITGRAFRQKSASRAHQVV